MCLCGGHYTHISLPELSHPISQGRGAQVPGGGSGVQVRPTPPPLPPPANARLLVLARAAKGPRAPNLRRTMQNAHVTWSFGSGFPQRRTRSGRFSLVSHEFSDPRSWQPRGHGQFAGNQGRRGEGSGGRPIAQKPRRPVRQASVSSSRRKRRAQGAGRTSQARMSDRCRPRVTGAGPALPDSEPGRSRSPSPPSHPQHGPARRAGQGGGPPLSRPLSHPLTRSAVPSRPRGRSPEADVSTERRFTVPHGAPLGGGAGT